MARPEKTASMKNVPGSMHRQLGARLKAIRRSKGFTSSESFSLANNINRTQYANYERGMGDIQFSTLVRIVAGLGITLKEFFSEGFEE